MWHECGRNRPDCRSIRRTVGQNLAPSAMLSANQHTQPKPVGTEALWLASKLLLVLPVSTLNQRRQAMILDENVGQHNLTNHLCCIDFSTQGESHDDHTATKTSPGQFKGGTPPSSPITSAWCYCAARLIAIEYRSAIPDYHRLAFMPI